MDAESRGLLENYAKGVNRYIEERRDRLPIEFRVLRYHPKPWTPRDTALVAAYMYKVLTTTWDMELKRAKVTAKVRPDLARQLFVAESPLDHFIVGAEAAPQKGGKPKRIAATNFSISGGWIFRSAQNVLSTFEEETEAVAGSNNWVVDGRFSIGGKPLLANDTHLPLSVPCMWSVMHLTAPGWNVKGFVLPGTPLVIIGHNERIAWGFTNNGADVQDLYVETFNPANPRQYRVNGEWRGAEIRAETIHVRGKPDEELEVVVTRHGPIVEREGDKAFALRWTATEPGGLSVGYPFLGRAKNWQEFREALKRVSGPAQNIVYADVDGNIGYSLAAKIPVRNQGLGEVPVPGESDDYQWSGWIPFEQLPVAFNPPDGMIATANARVVGPGYAPYLTDHWVAPYRTDRIYSLLQEKKKFRAPDFIAMQADLVSTPHRLIADHLLRAAKHAKPKDDRAEELLSRIPHWDGKADRSSRVMAFLEFTRRVARRKILETYLGADYRLYDWYRSEVFLQNVLRDRPAEWLPKEFQIPGRSISDSYDVFLMQCADDAIAEMIREAQGENQIADWDWGRFVALQILHPLGRTGFLRRHLSIGPIPQSGASHSVKQTGRTFGPAMRFVADMANLDDSRMSLTLGQSGQYLSEHYRDQFQTWYDGRSIVSSFSEAAVESATVHRLRLVPSPQTNR
jgi:penicillin amidase